MSPAHFQRTFKGIVGLSCKQYLDAARLRNLKKGLKREPADVTESVYEAGYGSSRRIYERADTYLGMTSNQYWQGGLNVTISYATIETLLGLILIGATDRGLLFPAIRRYAQRLADDARKGVWRGATRGHKQAVSSRLSEVDGSPE